MLGGSTAKLWVCVVFAAGFGGVQMYRGVRARTLIQVDLSRVEMGESLPGNWISARGRALWDQAAVQPSKKTAAYFVPVVSERWQKGSPVAMFLLYRIPVEDPPPSGTTELDTYEGTIVWSMIQGLGRRARTQFHDAGLQESEDYFLLNRGEKPEGLIRDGVLGLSIGGICLVLIPVVRWIERRWGVSGAAV